MLPRPSHTPGTAVDEQTHSGSTTLSINLSSHIHELNLTVEITLLLHTRRTLAALLRLYRHDTHQRPRAVLIVLDRFLATFCDPKLESVAALAVYHHLRSGSAYLQCASSVSVEKSGDVRSVLGVAWGKGVDRNRGAPITEI